MNRQNQILQEKLNQLLAGKQGLKALEAGCGSISHIDFPGVEHCTGIDISDKQLARNENINEKILGDIQTYPIPTDSYDVIVSWDVLEHLPEPGKALQNFFQALRKGGIIVLAAPNIYSLKGVVTFLAPHAFQVFFYRHIIGDTRAGRDDHGPFKTFLHKDMWPRRIRDRAESSQLDIVYYSEYEGPVPTHLRNRHRFIDIAFGLMGSVSRTLTGGKLDLTASDFMLIIQK